MNGKLVRGSIKSIGTSFIIIFVCLAITFLSFKTALIGMIPNVTPVLLIGAVMGYANIPIDMITAMVMPMILGIAVDDTIHFTNHIKYQFEKCGNYRKAIEASYREIGKSMIMTTIILSAMFFIFLFSTMNCLVRIGYLSIIGLGSALIADYTLTPVLMLICKPFGKEKNKQRRAEGKSLSLGRTFIDFLQETFMKKIISVLLLTFLFGTVFAQTGYDIMKKADEVPTPKAIEPKAPWVAVWLSPQAIVIPG